MDQAQENRLIAAGGVCGIVGTLCYVAAITFSMGVSAMYITAMAWPLLSVVFVLSLYHFVARENQSPANQLACVFAFIGFAMVGAMISVQLAVRTGMPELLGDASSGGHPGTEGLPEILRLVDMGLDVAWDCFVGVSLMLLAVAVWRRRHLGPWWGVPAGLLGAGLIVLNIATFPWPPATRGLFDIGPAVGLYIIALSARLLFAVTLPPRNAAAG